MKQIAEMLSAAFDKKPNALIKWYSIWNYEEQLKERLVRLVEMGKDHAMLIAYLDKETVDDSHGKAPLEMCGFIELGLLPLPKDRMSETSDIEEELLEILNTKQMLPTIGNLVVDEKWRKNGVGTAMLNEATHFARRWRYPVIICAVNPDNIAAVKLYEKNGFKCAFTAKTTVQINVIRSQQDLKIMVKRVPST